MNKGFVMNTGLFRSQGWPDRLQASSNDAGISLTLTPAQFTVIYSSVRNDRDRMRGYLKSDAFGDTILPAPMRAAIEDLVRHEDATLEVLRAASPEHAAIVERT